MTFHSVSNAWMVDHGAFLSFYDAQRYQFVGWKNANRTLSAAPTVRAHYFPKVNTMTT